MNNWQYSIMCKRARICLFHVISHLLRDVPQFLSQFASLEVVLYPDTSFLPISL